MMYCERCQRLYPEGRCPSCGRQGRGPAPDDVCFLTERGGFLGGMLADVLEQNQIPFLQKGTMGAGMAVKVGPLGERFRFYVACRDVEKAQEIVDELFGQET